MLKDITATLDHWEISRSSIEGCYDVVGICVGDRLRRRDGKVITASAVSRIDFPADTLKQGGVIKAGSYNFLLGKKAKPLPNKNEYNDTLGNI